MKKIIFIILVFLSVGCSTFQSKIEEKSSRTEIDSTNVFQKERDSISTVLENFKMEKDSISNVLKKVKKERDSISIETEKIIIPETKVGTTIENPCDSIGNLKNGKYFLTAGRSNLEVSIANNKIAILSETEGFTGEIRREYREKSKLDSISFSQYREQKRLDSIAFSKYKEQSKLDSIARTKEIESLKSRSEYKVRYKTRLWVWILLGISLSLNLFIIKKVGLKSVVGSFKSLFRL